ncbi:MAG: asparagine synthase (glutamine-hydrolyzing), partial [Chitinophagales bacterium]
QQIFGICLVIIDIYRMCGIAGIVQFHPQQKGEEYRNQMSRRLKKMSDRLIHRGPDGEGFWISPNGFAGFGHRRLSIIDLSPAAAQPMTFNDRYTIVYNGEIYNYIELRDELKNKGYHFSTRSDTEVLLAAYDCYQEACLTKLDGMFAFAIWDETQRSVFAARDRFGEKPFFYTINDREFCFASEKKALWAIGTERRINQPLLLNYLVLGRTETAADNTITFYQDIFSLPPAHFLTLKFSESTFDMQRYWDCNKEAQPDMSDASAIEQFQERLTISIKRRMRMDVRLGACLSGGLDSSSLVSLLLANTSEKIPSFSAIFPGFVHDESAYINKMVSTFDLDNLQIAPDEKDLVKDMERVCYHQEEPFSSSSIFVQFKLYELAAAGQVKVLMDGQGADEVMAGYTKYIPWYLQKLFRSRPAIFFKEKRELEKNQFAFDWGWKNYPAALLPVQVVRALERKEARRIRKSRDINPEFKKAFFDRQSIYKPVVLKLNDILYFDACQFGLEELLRYADRNSMAHGLELRLPFLSHELVELLFSLPDRFKIREGYTKWILRKSMEDKLPPEIAWRRGKVGFEPPQKTWMQNKDLQDKIHESKKLLVDEKILSSGVLNKKIQPQDAHAAENKDWRYLNAAFFLSKNLFADSANPVS